MLGGCHAPNAAQAAKLGVMFPALGKPPGRAVFRPAKPLVLHDVSCGRHDYRLALLWFISLSAPLVCHARHFKSHWHLRRALISACKGHGLPPHVEGSGARAEHAGLSGM